jgi:6-phosphogluconolactonase/glucosamine-6-phosphate isomerase/deaminase
MYLAGENKAEAVEAAIERPLDIARYPSQLLRDAGDRVEWIMDRSAAARLRGVPPA